MFLKRKLPEFVNEEEVYALAGKIVDLAKQGLLERGYDEEILLEPLYERIKTKTNPAKRLLELKEQGVDLESIILEYGNVN